VLHVKTLLSTAEAPFYDITCSVVLSRQAMRFIADGVFLLNVASY
jgi:hypothetical protein